MKQRSKKWLGVLLSLALLLSLIPAMALTAAAEPSNAGVEVLIADIDCEKYKDKTTDFTTDDGIAHIAFSTTPTYHEWYGWYNPYGDLTVTVTTANDDYPISKCVFQCDAEGRADSSSPFAVTISYNGNWNNTTATINGVAESSKGLKNIGVFTVVTPDHTALSDGMIIKPGETLVPENYYYKTADHVNTESPESYADFKAGSLYTLVRGNIESRQVDPSYDPDWVVDVFVANEAGNRYAFADVYGKYIFDGGWAVTSHSDGLSVKQDKSNNQNYDVVTTYTFSVHELEINDVTLAATANGSVNVYGCSDDTVEVEAGKTVTLAVAPSTGYQLDSISASYLEVQSVSELMELMGTTKVYINPDNTDESDYFIADGNSIKFYNWYNPDSPRVELSSTKNLNTENSDKGIYTATGSGDITWKFTVKKGKINNIAFIMGGNEYPYAIESTGAIANPTYASVSLTTVTAGETYTFTMPATDVTVSAAFKAHTHSFTYTVSSDTITATCTGAGTCGLTNNQATLTVSAPDGTLTYDGETAFPATYSRSNTAAFPGTYTITYTKDGAAFTGEPSDAGAYVASVTVGTATASVSYTIAKAACTAEAVPAHMQWETVEDDGTITLAISCHSDEYHLNLVEGQEYVLAPSGQEPDWSQAKELTGESENYKTAVYTGLSPATEYTIYARVKETANTLAGEPVTTKYVTTLLSLGILGDSSFVGATATVVPEPEDAEGLTYQWYHATYVEEGDDFSYTVRGDAVPGAVGPTFTSTEDDVGKYYTVVISKADTELFCTEIGPIGYGVVEFDTCGGSEIANQTGTVFGDKVTKPANPTRDGYDFVAWYDDYDGETYTGEWDFENHTLEFSYEVLYAKWAPAQSNAGIYDYGGYTPASVAPAATTVTVPVSGEDATVNVKVEVKGDAAAIKEADVDKVLEAEDVGTVSIDVSGLKDNIDEVTIPGKMVDKIADAVADEDNSADGLEVKLPAGSVSFDADAVAAIAEQADGKDLTLHLDNVKVTELTSGQQEAVSDLEVEVVLDAYLTIGNGQRISDFKGGSATVKIPYTLKDGQLPAGLVVWYVAEDGTRTQVPATYDGEYIVFDVPHFSNYVVAYDEALAAECPKDESCPLSAFGDLDAAAWYHDGVHFVLANGIMNGMGDGVFDPDGATSRAMIVTILYRLEGEPMIRSGMPFSDVTESDWYAMAVSWAESRGIVNGFEDGTFRPNDPITREQLATILYRYAQYKGEGFTGAWAFQLDFPDAGEVSEWADEAMHWMVMNGVINGKDGKLVPAGNASRAEAATMIFRFCGLMPEQ